MIARYINIRIMSRSIIGGYRLGKKAPTYESALIFAEVLGLD